MEIAIFYWRARRIGSAIAVVAQRTRSWRRSRSILHLASLAASTSCLQGDFVAVAQVLVYAGAVMVMFLFVIAYLGDRADRAADAAASAPAPRSWRGSRSSSRRVAVCDPSGLLDAPALGGRRRSARPATIGRLFLTDYLLAFEAISLVLLVGADRRRRARRGRPAAARASCRRGGTEREPKSERFVPRRDLQRRERGEQEHESEAAHDPRHRLLDPALGGALLIGLVGVMMRRNPLVILLSIEIMLNAQPAAGRRSRYVGGNDGQVSR